MIWGRVMFSNYLIGLTIDEWFLQPRKDVKNSSMVWKSLVDSFPIIGEWTMWRIGNEKSV
jgi:hypothetical protein